MSLALRLKLIRIPALLLLIFVAVALAATWPLAAQLGTQLPLGTEPTATVPYLNAWTLQWNIDRLAKGYAGYWDAPIFYPAEGAFAFSDPQPLTGLVSALFSPFGVAATYNLTLLGMLALNGLAAYLLLREVGASRFASVAGGVLVQLLPFLSHERGVLHLQPVFGMLFALRSALRLTDAPSPRRGLELGAWIAATFLVSEQFGLILLIALLPFVIWSLLSSKAAWRAWLFAGLLAAALAGPLFLTQSRILGEQGFQRSQASVEAGSGDWGDYLAPSPALSLTSTVGAGDTNFGLYPGLALVSLALLSLISHQQGRFRILLAVSAVLAFLLSLGLNLSIGDWQPYRLIWQQVPGFQHLRSPFRFGVWVQVSLALLAACAIDVLWAAKRRWLAVAALLLAVVEVFPRPTVLAPLPDPADLSAANSPAVFLPYVQGSSASAYTQTAGWMLLAQDNGLQIVNGYSGYFPGQNSSLKRELADFPSGSSLETLEELGVRSVIVPADWWAAHLAEAPQPDGLGTPHQADAFLIFSLDP